MSDIDTHKHNTKKRTLSRDKGAYLPKTRGRKMKRPSKKEAELVKKPNEMNKSVSSHASMPLSLASIPPLQTSKMMPSSPCSSPKYAPISPEPESPRGWLIFKPLEKENEKRAIDFFSQYMGPALEVTSIEVEDSHLENGSAYLTISISETQNVMRPLPSKIFYSISNIECNYPDGGGCYGIPTFLDIARGLVTHYVTSPKNIHGDLEYNYHFGDILQKVVEIAGYQSMLSLKGKTFFVENKVTGSMVPVVHKIKLKVSLKPYY
jgi:hypothetical protein